MWEKIVLNLVSNAFKYTLAGEIEVTLACSGREVELSVRDTGTGVPPEHLPRLFERFHRIEGARGRTHEGTGIGLALVHELVHLHGGRVTAASEVDRGSTFTVALPLGSAHLPQDRVFHSASRPQTAARSNAFVEEALQWVPRDAEAADRAATPSAPWDAGQSDAGIARILLADDNADMRDYVRRLLEPRWQLETVGNGLAALDAIRRSRPDLVITDVMMPEMDGFAFLRAVRGDADLRELPVMMLSARAGEEATLEALESGADDYLVKPFSARELVTRVEAALMRSRIRAVEEENRRRLETVFKQAPVAVALLRGPDFVFEIANPEYRKLAGNRPLVGKPFLEALPELTGQGIFELLDGVRRSGQPSVGRSQRILINARGTRGPDEHFYDFVYQPIVDPSGATEAIAAVIYDVTALTRARREAEIASRAKDEFLAMLGHELRNPLAPIRTALQLMRLRGIDGADRERQVIERQVNHLVGLVDDLLDVSRITRGKVQLQRQPLEVADVVAKAIETASPLLEQKGHTLEIDVARTGLLVDADPERLAQVLANLLTNAAKYTEARGQVFVSAAVDGEDIVIRVRDTGIGIAPDMLPRVFDLFVQERQALDRAQGGLGLGLAIVRSLTQLHGGRVEAHSDGQGQGSEFVLRLPRLVTAAAPARPDGPVPDSLEVRTPAHSRRVLIVDDNEDAATMLREVLVACGHAVRSAHDGPSALRAAEEFLPEIALVDIGLPVMDGYELARRFTAHSTLNATRLIALTGYGQEQDRRRSEAAGFVAHLVKPVALTQLRRLVESAETPQADPPAA